MSSIPGGIVSVVSQCIVPLLSASKDCTWGKIAVVVRAIAARESVATDTAV